MSKAAKSHGKNIKQTKFNSLKQSKAHVYFICLAGLMSVVSNGYVHARMSKKVEKE